MSGNDKNIFIHAATVTSGDRETRSGHKGCVLWFTGLSGSGKSTLANRIEADLFKVGANTYILDGDNVRHGLNSDLGFSPEDRNENIRRVGEVAKLLADAGLITLVCFISPYRTDRDSVREKLEEGRFFEVFVDCPLEVCEARDPKGLYKKARAGEIPEFTGINAPYEPPLSPEVVVDTSAESLDECSRKVLDALRKGAIITNLKEGG